LKELTRGKTSITKNDIQQFIETLNISGEVMDELRRITPQNYVGVAPNY
jgi:adenylosuccinate lyase